MKNTKNLHVCMRCSHKDANHPGWRSSRRHSVWLQACYDHTNDLCFNSELFYECKLPSLSQVTQDMTGLPSRFRVFSPRDLGKFAAWDTHLLTSRTSMFVNALSGVEVFLPVSSSSKGCRVTHLLSPLCDSGAQHNTDLTLLWSLSHFILWSSRRGSLPVSCLIHSGGLSWCSLARSTSTSPSVVTLEHHGSEIGGEWLFEA